MGMIPGVVDMPDSVTCKDNPSVKNSDCSDKRGRLVHLCCPTSFSERLFHVSYQKEAAFHVLYLGKQNQSFHLKGAFLAAERQGTAQTSQHKTRDIRCLLHASSRPHRLRAAPAPAAPASILVPAGCSFTPVPLSAAAPAADIPLPAAPPGMLTSRVLHPLLTAQPESQERDLNSTRGPGAGELWRHLHVLPEESYIWEVGFLLSISPGQGGQHCLPVPVQSKAPRYCASSGFSSQLPGKGKKAASAAAGAASGRWCSALAQNGAGRDGGGGAVERAADLLNYDFNAVALITCCSSNHQMQFMAKQAPKHFSFYED
ncbi:uncharacterized protein LOC118168113 isoform X2 [Oxyura jamaicensis]|uniref:uncharacterized protein LOC118168113 isoform X2 n=1 Tax=Oxyura jamaicensis TaxID=8884 RepID=UPI0015A570A8|nr:uncharacterized protein LOC118168113 isoform X2 [Oxyura jamaicensis]